MVTSADIARLGGVGRAAVSNWRRRYADFPPPIAGTASSPMFSLQAVQSWLSANGRPVRVTLAEQVWQRLRGGTADLELGRAVACVGAHLLRRYETRPVELPGGVSAGALQRPMRAALDELAEENGAPAAFEQICERYQSAHARTLATTSTQVARLMARMLGPEPGTLLDPACGIGTLPLHVEASRVLAQDADPVAAAIAAARLRLADLDAEVATGDSLRENGFVDRQVDAVLCDPPFNARAWGHGELAGDPRWAYGQPPRGEPELAWAQHCLAAVRPGGTVVMLMPQAVAGRRAGKRIRANLLRAGALASIHSLSDGHDIWRLQRPTPETTRPTSVLLREHGRRPEQAQPGEHPEYVPIINLLDDVVDLSPARQRLLRERADVRTAFRKTRDAFNAAATSINTGSARELDTQGEHRLLPTTTLAELIKSGALTILTPEPGGADLPVLTAADLAANRPPSSATDGYSEVVHLHRGDVVASPTGLARVVTEESLLGQQLTAYRAATERLDPHFLAGAFRAAAPKATGSTRIDPRRIEIPTLSLDRQRAYAAAFEQLDAAREAAYELAEIGDSLARLGFAGLVDGQIGPPEPS